MDKMNDRVPKERLGTSRLNDVFLKIYSYFPTSKFQELEIGSDLTFMQSKIKICKTDFSQTKKMWNQKLPDSVCIPLRNRLFAAKPSRDLLFIKLWAIA